MKPVRIYVVHKADRDNELIGTFDRAGLKKYLKAHRKKGQWSSCYWTDKKGRKKFLSRIKSYTFDDIIQVTSFPLNKESYGREIEWNTFK
jgi:hypothetical protein